MILNLLGVCLRSTIVTCIITTPGWRESMPPIDRLKRNPEYSSKSDDDVYIYTWLFTDNVLAGVKVD